MAATAALLAQMRGFVEQQAAARGYALASLGALFDRPDNKRQPYSVVTHLTSSTPFGPLFSLDGVHPSAFGHAILALEAARAFNARYGANFARASSAASLMTDVGDVGSPTLALELARGVAAQNRGIRLSPCLMPGECKAAGPRR